MRFNASIIACATCLTLTSEAALRFTEPVWRPDMGISVPCLVGAVAAPIDLPKAEAYLMSGSGGMRLEDRFDTFELWTSEAVRGRWRDRDGNVLIIARLASLPIDDAPGSVRTRKSYRDAQSTAKFDPKNAHHRDEAAEAVSPVDLGRAAAPRRSQRKNLTGLVCYPCENDHILAYAFRPRNPERLEKPDWFLVILSAARSESMAAVRARFDDEFLDRISVPSALARRSLARKSPAPDDDASETDLLRADLRASVANYDEWCCTEAEDVLVLDDLDPGLRSSLVAAVTNNLPRIRREYARVVPSPLSTTNALAVVRIFRDKNEYLAYVGEEQQWTAALWSPSHRELALYHPDAGNEQLLRTVWHEAFHQYLSYAGSMIESSPWFNEGTAQLFQFSHFDATGKIVFDRDERSAAYVHEYAVSIAEMLPDIIGMDYAEFYDGTPEEVRARYRIAWSIAYFLEVGAPKLRFRPYERLRADYMKALVQTQSMQKASDIALGGEKGRAEFVAAWLAFWRRN